jgi:hypothetical protein
VTRAFLVFCLVLVAVSFVFSGTARAVRDPQEDYCLKESTVCISGCDQYNVRIWGVTVPTVLTGLCITECGIAYAGCLMRRFREGV